MTDDLIRQIDEFRASCEENEHTDTGEAWDLLLHIRKILVHRQHADDPDDAIYWVDIPDSGDLEGSWKNVGTFDSWAEAARYAADTFGADEKGRVRLITMGRDEDK